MKMSKAHIGMMSLVSLTAMQLTAWAGDIEDTPLNKNGGSAGGSGGSLGDMFRMFAALLIVAGLLWVAYKLMMKFSKRNMLGQVGQGSLKVLQSRAISPKHSVVVLQAGAKTILLGLSPNSVSNLCELENAEDIEKMEKEFITDRSEKETD